MNIFIDHLINSAQEPNIGEMIKGKNRNPRNAI